MAAKARVVMVLDLTRAPTDSEVETVAKAAGMYLRASTLLSTKPGERTRIGVTDATVVDWRPE